MFGTRSFHTIFIPSPFAVTIAGLGAALWLAASAGPAAAAEKPADLDKYCKSRYGRDYVTNIDRRDDGLMCTKSTSGGLGLLHRKVRAADICQAQHKTRRFRRTGKGLICITGAGGGGRAAKSVDLKKYCKDKYGPQAFVTRRQTDDRPMCTLKTGGGLGQRYHVIDLAGLCGGGAPRVSGTTLECGGSTVAGGGKGPASPGSEKGPAGGGKGPTPPGSPAPPGSAKGPAGGNGGGSKATGSATSGGNRAAAALRKVGGRLDGCAVIADRRNFSVKDAKGRDWDQGGVEFPCPHLTGGWSTNVQEFCELYWNAPAGSESAGWFENVPRCGWIWDGKWQPFRQFQLGRACLLKLKVLTGQSPQNLYEERRCSMAIRWTKKKIDCFLVKKETIERYVKQRDGIGGVCRRIFKKRGPEKPQKYIEGET